VGQHDKDNRRVSLSPEFLRSSEKLLSQAMHAEIERGAFGLPFSLDCGRSRVPPTAAWRSDLLENREEELGLDGNRLRIELGSNEILTVEIAFEEA